MNSIMNEKGIIMVIQDRKPLVILLLGIYRRFLTGCLFFAARLLGQGYRCGPEPFSFSVERLYPREVQRGGPLWHNRDFAKVTIMLAAYFVSRCASSALAVFDSHEIFNFYSQGIPGIHNIQTLHTVQSIHIPEWICNVHSIFPWHDDVNAFCVIRITPSVTHEKGPS